jgi:hypothetical protein
MKCLACGHDNEAGEASCVSCFASLNLQLCPACEAINAENAARCHSCAVQLSLEPGVVEVLSPYASLPSAWVISGEPRPGSRGLRAALYIVPVLAVAAFGAYHYFSGVPEAQAVTAAGEATRSARAVLESPITELKVLPTEFKVAPAEESKVATEAAALVKSLTVE